MYSMLRLPAGYASGGKKILGGKIEPHVAGGHEDDNSFYASDTQRCRALQS
jgi:hypothetical protein